MEPGHTKCICDACFSKIRQLYRRSDVDLPEQLGDLVNASARVNKVQMHSNTTGEEIVKWYSWDKYLSSFMRPLKGIRKYHHFRFIKADAGAVYVKQSVDDEEERVSLLLPGKPWPPPDDCVPDHLPAAGLSDIRKKDFLDHILQFVRPPFQEDFKSNFCD